ncbi:MAG: translation initiation factor IF-6 [Candidatus Nanohaloarchaea archaeon]
MAIEKYNYLGNQNVGFYVTSAGETTVVPPEFDSSDVIDGEVIETYIGKTRLVGLFTAGNSNCILLPGVTREREREKFDEKDVDYTVLDARETALGNLILANDSGAVVSSRLEDHRKEVEEALEVPVQVVDIADTENPGSAGVTNNHGAVIHRDSSEETARAVKDALDLERIDIGTINMGSPYVGSGAVATSSDALVGEETTGPEIGRIDRNLFQHD